MPSTSASTWVAVTEAPLSSDELSAWVVRPHCGAVVTFSGVVRDHSRAHDDVVALEYETSPKLAEQRLNEVVEVARERWPSLEAVAIHHRIGAVELSEHHRRRRRFLASPQRRLRRRALLHRHLERDGAHVEARDLGGRLGLE